MGAFFSLFESAPAEQPAPSPAVIAPAVVGPPPPPPPAPASVQAVMIEQATPAIVAARIAESQGKPPPPPPAPVPAPVPVAEIVEKALVAQGVSPAEAKKAAEEAAPKPQPAPPPPSAGQTVAEAHEAEVDALIQENLRRNPHWLDTCRDRQGQAFPGSADYIRYTEILNRAAALKDAGLLQTPEPRFTMVAWNPRGLPPATAMNFGPGDMWGNRLVSAISLVDGHMQGGAVIVGSSDRGNVGMFLTAPPNEAGWRKISVDRVWSVVPNNRFGAAVKPTPTDDPSRAVQLNGTPVAIKVYGGPEKPALAFCLQPAIGGRPPANFFMLDNMV